MLFEVDKLGELVTAMCGRGRSGVRALALSCLASAATAAMTLTPQIWTSNAPMLWTWAMPGLLCSLRLPGLHAGIMMASALATDCLSTHQHGCCCIDRHLVTSVQRLRIKV